MQWVSGSPEPQVVEFLRASPASGSGTSFRRFRSLAAGSIQQGVINAGRASVGSGTVSVSSQVSSYARRDMCGECRVTHAHTRVSPHS